MLRANISAPFDSYFNQSSSIFLSPLSKHFAKVDTFVNLKQLVERFICCARLATNGSRETSKYEKDQPKPLNTNEFIAAVLTFAPALAPIATPACWRSLPDVSTRAVSNYSHYLELSISFTMI